jgi:hypothetical protein
MLIRKEAAVEWLPTETQNYEREKLKIQEGLRITPGI